MPTNAELLAILRFRDQASREMQAVAKNFQASMKSIGETVEKASLEMRRISRDLMQIGAILTGPFVLAFRTAAQQVPAVRDAVNALGTEMTAFQVSLAQAALPVLQDLVNLIHRLREAFDELDPATRDFVIRAVFMGGIVALLIGIFGRLVADIILVASKLWLLIAALNPVALGWIAVVAGVAVVLNAFGLLGPAIQLIIQLLDFLVLAGRQTIEAFLLPFKLATWGLVAVLQALFELAGKLPDQLGGKMFRDATRQLDSYRLDLEHLTIKGAQNVQKFGDAAMNALVGKEKGPFGKAAAQVRGFAQVFNELMNILKGGGAGSKGVSASALEGMKQDWNRFWTDYANITKRSVDIMKGAVSELEGRLTTMFRKMITEGMKAKDVMREFGLAILETVATMIAKFLAFIATVAVVAAVLAAFGVPPGATFKAAFALAGLTTKHHGGMITRADMPRYHEGGEIPIMAQEGEFVVNRDATARNRSTLERINRGQDVGGNGGGGGGPQIVNIWNVTATDAQSFRALMQQNNDLVEGMFQRAIRRGSGPMREAVRLA